ncbi:MAG: AbrB/MazE/SpoVT family DNA-binding domain-containing protein [Lachnospiraceae bacterium]|jgi:antitoxin MazE|nr:AbrB/MazE/SpoVT family DNA-binding domain-containing protein [Lachnospiraceae bacterium]MBR3734422.1 AbrB/MazE/SpoVT family DNA-binding domain-containing protein [Lachnospiraceae bacterium]MBR6156105.1 AbrB/MazE/SpoVT family DNA-binding domain-containing protein [Lachnospiraceae bacterium]
MQTQIKNWGNSQGIRLSKEAMQEAGFEKDEILTVTVSKGQIILQKRFRHKTLKERMDEYGGKLELVEEMDFGEPGEGEIW